MIRFNPFRLGKLERLERQTVTSLNELLIICSQVRVKLTHLEQELEQIQKSIDKLNSYPVKSNPYDPDHNNYN